MPCCQHRKSERGRRRRIAPPSTWAGEANATRIEISCFIHGMVWGRSHLSEHASFVDFLYKKERSKDYHVDPEEWMYTAFCDAFSLGCNMLGLRLDAGIESALWNPKDLSFTVASSLQHSMYLKETPNAIDRDAHGLLVTVDQIGFRWEGEVLDNSFLLLNFAQLRHRWFYRSNTWLRQPKTWNSLCS